MKHTLIRGRNSYHSYGDSHDQEFGYVCYSVSFFSIAVQVRWGGGAIYKNYVSAPFNLPIYFFSLGARHSCSSGS